METILAQLAAYNGVLPIAELRMMEERLRLATEAAEIGWRDVEEGHGELSWPPRVKAMFGISSDAPVSMHDFYSGLHPDDKDQFFTYGRSSASPDGCRRFYWRDLGLTGRG